MTASRPAAAPKGWRGDETLTSASTKRLNKKGGSLKASAATSFSTLVAASRTVKVARRR